MFILIILAVLPQRLNVMILYTRCICAEDVLSGCIEQCQTIFNSFVAMTQCIFCQNSFESTL